MNDCRPEELEALLDGELSAPRLATLAAHLEGCARCSRENAWLVAERELFAQRALREAEPRALWSAVDARAHGPRHRASTERWRRVGLGVAASLLLLVTFGPRGASPPPHSFAPVASGARSFSDELGFSPDPQSGIVTLEQRYGACLVATPNAASRCGALSAIPASFSFSQP